jgi:AraC-like DNA-binding protein
MNRNIYQQLEPTKELAPFVKNILVFKGTEKTVQTNLPFFADGFPGILYHTAKARLAVYPHKKVLPAIFVYGQTIQPIEIRIKGAFIVIIFQLYPFVLKTLFDIRPETITDNCYPIPAFEKEFEKENNSVTQDISELLDRLTRQFMILVKNRKLGFDPVIRQAIEKILATNGKIKLSSLARELHIHVRTLERRFREETALQPKQFARIIQFQSSLIQMSINDYKKLADVVYENGYADQSHFIRVFKSFTGKTPRTFAKK